VSAVWGWVLVAGMTSFVGLAMAEIVSALPSSGGPYFWASVLGGDRWGPLAAWVTGKTWNTVYLSEAVRQKQAVFYYRCILTGWFNLLGQVAVTAAIEYTLANHLSAMIVLGTGGAGTGGKIITQGQLLGIYAGEILREAWHHTIHVPDHACVCHVHATLRPVLL